MNTDEYVKMMGDNPGDGMTVPGKPKNDYIGLMENYEQEHQAQFKSSVTSAAAVSPDEIARKKRIANIMGTPLSAVEGNPDMAKSMATVKTIQDDTKDAPGLRQKYTDADFAKLAHDQSGNLSLIERTVRNFAAGFGGDLAGSAVSGMGHTLNAMQRLLRSKESYNALMAEGWAPFGQGLVDVGETTKKYWQSLAPTDQGFSDQVVRGIGQMTGQLPLFAVSAPAGIATMFGQGSDQMAEKIKMDKEAQKADQANQDLEILSGGAITATTEWLTSKLLLKPPQLLMLKNKLLAYSAKVALGGVEEGSQELLENISQDLAHIAITNPESKVAFGEAIEAGGVGAIVGVVASGVINGALHIRGRRSQQTFAELSDATKNQKLKERDPGTYQGFADSVAAHLASTTDGAVENLYVDANTFHQVMTDAKLDPNEVAKFVPAMAEQLDEARVSGGDIVIPLNEFVGKLAGTDVGDMLSPHLRSTPDSPSMAELEKASQIAPDLQANAEAIMSKQEERAEWQKSANEVQKTIFDQISATGVYTAPVARAYASMVRDFYVTQAANLGMSPAEFYEAHPYKIASGEIGAEAVTQNTTISLQTNQEETSKMQGFEDTKGLERQNIYVGGKEVGYIDAAKNDDTLYVNHIALDDRYQRRGIGTQALDELQRQRGTNRVSVTTGFTSAGKKFFDKYRAEDRIRYDQTGRINTETPEFKKWFGDSKVVDEAGKPLVVYHGTRGDFTEFKTQDNGYSAFYFSPDKKFAMDSAKAPKHKVYGRTGAPKVVPAYLSLTNPKIVSIEESFFISDAEVNAAKDAGHDGVIGMYNGKPFEYLAFSPTQIKSVNNRGTWDPNDPNILNQADDRDKAWRNWEPEVTSTGKIKGAPEWVNNRSDLNAMRRTLGKFLREGASGRMWYENSADAVMRMVNNDVVKAEKFIQLLAIYSPNSNVWVNTIQAVKAYTHWSAGLSAETLSVGSAIGDGKAIDVLYNGKDWEGRKTNSFYLNLMHDIVLKYPDSVGQLNLDPAFVEELSLPVTIDVWIGRAFGYDNASFGNDKGSGKYSFSENEIRRMTARLNASLPEGEPSWTPHQVQAAIWTAIKSRYEIKSVKEKTNRKSIREGLIKIEDGKPVYPKDADGMRQHLANWRHFAMQSTSEEVAQAAEDGARSFGEDLDRMTEVITWEAIPSTSLAYDIHKASPEAKRLFTAAAKNLMIDEYGNDVLAYLLGTPLSYSGLGYGAYAGGVNSNVLSHILPARKTGQDGFSVDEVRAYCRAIQYIFKQDAVPWFRADNRTLLSTSVANQQKFRVINKAGKPVKTFESQADAESYATPKGYSVRGGNMARAFVIQFGRNLDSNGLNAVLSSLQGYLGEDAGFTRTAANEITIVNFRDDETKLPFVYDEDFISAVESFVKDNEAQLAISSRKKIWAEGEYGNVEDWTKSPEGAGILSSGSLSGRPDLHSWIRDRRDAFEKLLQEYSGENLASIEKQSAGSVLWQSARRDAASSSRAKRKSAPGAISAVGVHYSKSARKELSSSYFGSGMASAESARLADAPDLRERLYFYINAGNGVFPEAGVGSYPHTVNLDNLYDSSVDPLDLKIGRTTNDFERAVIKAGYDGYLNRDYGVAVLLGKRTVPVQSSEATNVPEVEAAKWSPAQMMSQELKANQDIPQGMMSGPRWIERLQEDFPELYQRLDEAGYIEPLKGQEKPIRRSEIPFVGGQLYQSSPSQFRKPTQAEKNAIYDQVLGVADSGPFDGGCVYFAKALQKVIGGDLVSLVSTKNGSADHVAVSRGGMLIDMDGPLAPDAFIKRFEKNENVKISGYRDFEEADLPEAPRGTDVEQQTLAGMLRPLFSGSLYQSAWHGSPYTFDKFSTEKIGTGEGAQSYGYGLYFAGKKEVAEYYRDALSAKRNLGVPTSRLIGSKLSRQEIRIIAEAKDEFDRWIKIAKVPYPRESFRDYIEFYNFKWKISDLDTEYYEANKEQIDGQIHKWESEVRAKHPEWSDEKVKEALDYFGADSIRHPYKDAYDAAFKIVKKHASGRLYKVELAPDEDEFLLWDKPLSEQSEKVQPAFLEAMKQKALPELGNPELNDPKFKLPETVTGAYLYHTLRSHFGSQKAASDYLHSLGIRGVKYLDGSSRGKGDGSFNYVIFSEDDVAITEMYQKMAGSKRGGFSPTSLTTILTEQSDYSTFLHETAHFFLTTYAEMASDPNAPAKIQEDMQTLLNWFGVPDVATWNAMPLEDQRKHHEAFAYNYEIYLFEGKSPNPKMQGVFERFSAWLKKIYQSITTELNQIYRQEHGTDLPILTGEVKQVMDRMLASDRQIEQAEQIRGMAPIFTNQQDAGMSDEEWQAYQDMNVEAHDEALAKHRTASLRQMQWLDNARSRILKGLQAINKDTRRAMVAEVTEHIQNLPIYRAKFALKGATEMEALAIADSLGYSSVEDLKTAIANAPKMKDVIREETDRRMLEEHGELTDPKAMEREVDEALHNEARARFIGVELRHLSQTTRPVRVMQEAAKQAARSILGKKAVKDIRPRDFLAAEAKAAAAAEQAMRKGDTAAATQFKEHQLLQNQLAAEALKANTQITKSLESFKKVFAADKRISKSRDTNYVNVARAILAHYGFGATDQPASFYLTKIKAYDPDFFAEIEPMITAHQIQAKPANQLTLDEFTDLSDQVQALWHISRRNKQIEIDGKLLDRKAVVKELNEATDEINTAIEKPGYKRAMTKWEETKIKLLGMRASMRRVEAWVDAMDRGNPNGPFRRYIWNPISDSVTKYRMAKKDYMTEYLGILKEAEPLLNQRDIAAPEIGYTFNHDNSSELLHAILHTGNESNKRKLLLGRDWATLREDGKTLDTTAWDSFIARAIKEGIITKAHFDFAQKIWDFLEKMKPEAQRSHRQMYGFYFNEITAMPFETPFGVYAGGYVPAVTDIKLVSEGAMRNEQETQMGDNSFMFPTTGRGFTKGRVDEYTRPLLLNIGYLGSHIDKVLRFTHIEPKVKDVARIVKTSRSFASAMDDFDQTVRGDMLVPWLQRTAMQAVSTPSKGWGGKAADAVFTYLRTTAGMQIMVANITNTLQQFTGVSIAALRVKPSLLRNALWQYVRQPGDTTKMILEKSDFMDTRMTSYQFEIQRAVDELLLDPSKFEKLQEFAKQHGYFMQQETQGIVDTITWLGAYNQAVEANEDEKEAVRRADSAVRMTQGSFAPEDVSRIETGSPFMRAFTHFYAYFNMMANVLGTEFANVSRNMGVKAGAGKMLYIYTFGYMIPAVLSEMIVQAAGGFDAGDDDEYDLWDAMRLFFTAQARPLAAMVPGIGPAVLAGINTFNSKPYDDRMSTSPAVSAIEATVRAPSSVYKAIAEEGSWGRASKDVLTGLGMVTQLPLGQLGKPVGYAVGVAEGKIQPQSGADVARGLLSGKDVNRKQ